MTTWTMTKRKRIYHRDQGICQLCGQPVAFTFGTDPEALSLDHRIPRYLGGSGKDENLQLTHKICNWLKGQLEDPNLSPDKKLEAQIMLITRAY